MLPKNNLTGRLDAFGNHFSNLRVLRVYVNKLWGTIPSSLGELGGLTDLALEDNRLSGTIPASIGKLDRLTFIDVHGNHLTGLVPPLPFAQYTSFCSFEEPVVGGTNKFACPLPSTCGHVPGSNVSCPACDAPHTEPPGAIAPRCH